ncbi:MAG: HAD family hydrolase [Candidatus Competibacteraceae bacterium]|nr:HAD family hydrolase [Candidatus Competibacteraceae bacterium]
MSLALFDLDNTLLGGDSDYLWGQFLVAEGIVAPTYTLENQRYYQAYEAGTLDIADFLQFSLRVLADHDPGILHGWRTRFIETRIRPVLLPKAQALLQRHRDAGDTLLIITATNRFVTQPIADLLNVPHLLATEVEMQQDRYTGRFTGTPCFQEGKVQRLRTWLQQTGHTLENSWFYSDSHNDLPLLQQVTHPVAVNPDTILADTARTCGWPIISLRD